VAHAITLAIKHNNSIFLVLFLSKVDMFTTAAGKHISDALSPFEQILVEKLDIPPALVSVLQENVKACHYLCTFPYLSVNISIEMRLQLRFHHKTYLNSSIRKIKRGDIPPGCHLILAVAAIEAQGSVVVTDFFQFMKLKLSRAMNINSGDILRLVGSRSESGFLIGNPNGLTKVALDVPLRVNYFGVQRTLPAVLPLKFFVDGEVPYMRLVIYKNLASVLIARTDSESHIVVEEDRDEFLALYGSSVVRLEWHHRALVTDPWGTKFMEFRYPPLSEDGCLVSGESMDVINGVFQRGKSGYSPRVYLNRPSRVQLNSAKYVVSVVPLPEVNCDIEANSISEVSEGIFVLDHVRELRVDFKPGLFNSRKRLDVVRRKLLRPGAKILKNLRQHDRHVYFADVIDLEIS
jgi:hypothetical protein